IGLADDRYKLRPATKLIFQSLAAAILISFGVLYPVTPWTIVNVLVTFFWFLALTNALNLLDNMDGVAVGVAGIAALFLAATFVLEGAWMLGAVCLALAGAAFGFLPYNFHRASIFMGDSGSLFIGALLSGMGAAYPGTASASIVSVLSVPALIVVIPILDTFLVTVARTLAGRPISVGGRDHTSHRLVAMGLSERQVALLLYGFAACGGVLAILLRGASPGFAFVLGATFLVGLLLMAAYLGRMHTYAPGEWSSRRVTLLLTDLVHKRRAFEVVLDIILFALAYQCAYLLRWDGAPPPEQGALFERTLALAVVAKSASFGIVGAYRGTWHHLSIPDVHRLLRATALGSLVAFVGLSFVFPGGTFSRGVIVIDGLLAALFVVGARASFRSLDHVRHSLHLEGVPALLYGAGKGGELLLREVLSNADLALKPLGFLDDNPGKWGRLIHGYPVLGGVEDVSRLVARRGVQKILVCSNKVTQENLGLLRRACRELDVEVLRLHLELLPLDRVTPVLVLPHEEPEPRADYPEPSARSSVSANA
ncbi:MAG: hypothetical protein M3P24_00865, partial [Gemmatimonadota bacterium]|nr:hypothetical protein [Gemmatimonadota bacterium]